MWNWKMKPPYHDRTFVYLHPSDAGERGIEEGRLATVANENGSIEVETTANEGTSFKLRLPLTLAIIRCLLVRFRGGFFSMPIDDVREIVAVRSEDVACVHGHHTIDVRGEFIPLVGIDDVFQWSGGSSNGSTSGTSTDELRAVILQGGGRTMGLRVD